MNHDTRFSVFKNRLELNEMRGAERAVYPAFDAIAQTAMEKSLRGRGETAERRRGVGRTDGWMEWRFDGAFPSPFPSFPLFALEDNGGKWAAKAAAVGKDPLTSNFTLPKNESVFEILLVKLFGLYFRYRTVELLSPQLPRNSVCGTKSDAN